MGYEFLDHTADVKFRASGKSVDEVFEEAGNALIQTIKGGVDVKASLLKQISVHGDDLENLLYNFLEEFLFLLDAENFIGVDIKMIKVDEKNLSLIAELLGDYVQNYDDFSNGVKAITYSDMSVKKIGKKGDGSRSDGDDWEAVGVFDV